MYTLPVAAVGIWRTYKALKEAKKREKAEDEVAAADDERCSMLKFWSVFACWIMYGSYVEWIFSWVPGYSLVKLVSVVATFLMPTTLKVTDTIFAHMVLPSYAAATFAARRSVLAALVFFAQFVAPPPKEKRRSVNDQTDPRGEEWKSHMYGRDDAWRRRRRIGDDDVSCDSSFGDSDAEDDSLDDATNSSSSL